MGKILRFAQNDMDFFSPPPDSHPYWWLDIIFIRDIIILSNTGGLFMTAPVIGVVIGVGLFAFLFVKTYLKSKK